MYVAWKPYIENLFDDIKNEKTIIHVLICKYCKNNFDLLLQNHIITNKLNVDF